MDSETRISFAYSKFNTTSPELEKRRWEDGRKERREEGEESNRERKRKEDTKEERGGMLLLACKMFLSNS